MAASGRIGGARLLAGGFLRTLQSWAERTLCQALSLAVGYGAACFTYELLRSLPRRPAGEARDLSCIAVTSLAPMRVLHVLLLATQRSSLEISLKNGDVRAVFGLTLYFRCWDDVRVVLGMLARKRLDAPSDSPDGVLVASFL